MTGRIYLSAPDIRDLERDYVMGAIDSGWVAPAGPELAAFEEGLAEATGRKHGVVLASGTGAIHLALLALGVGQGDDVLCSSLTFIGSASPIVHCGARPVFVDSEITDWNVDPALLESLLEDRKAGNQPMPKAAVVVDLYGNCADYERIAPILERYGIPLVEDAAEALGASRDGRPAGSWGAVAVLSFNGNKIITSGGGGAVVTDDEQMAERVRYLSTQARQKTLHYEHTEIGYNYRMSSLAAAFGRAQLASLDDRIGRRRDIHQFYGSFLGDLGVELLDAPGESNYWLSCGRVRGHAPQQRRDAIIASLEAEDIESRPVWKPMHAQPIFADAEHHGGSISDSLFASGICLPSGSGMTDAELDRIRAALVRAADSE